MPCCIVSKSALFWGVSGFSRSHRFIDFCKFLYICDIFVIFKTPPCHANADACGLPPVATLCALLCRFPCPFMQFCAIGQKGRFGRFSASCGFKCFPCITDSGGVVVQIECSLIQRGRLNVRFAPQRLFYIIYYRSDREKKKAGRRPPVWFDMRISRKRFKQLLRFCEHIV